MSALTRRMPDGGTVHIEDIQDQVELALMREGHHKISRAYVIYREEHARARALEQAMKQPEADAGIAASGINVTLADGTRQPLDTRRLHAIVTDACAGLSDVDPQIILDDTERNLFDGVPYKDVSRMLVMSARTLIEKQPDYSYAASRLLLDDMRTEALSFVYNKPMNATQTEMKSLYSGYFSDYVKRAVDLELLDPRGAEDDRGLPPKLVDQCRKVQAFLGTARRTGLGVKIEHHILSLIITELDIFSVTGREIERRRFNSFFKLTHKNSILLCWDHRSI